MNRPGTYDIEDLRARFTAEERIYRLRCVEGWSMVIPWLGFPLSAPVSYTHLDVYKRQVEDHEDRRSPRGRVRGDTDTPMEFVGVWVRRFKP